MAGMLDHSVGLKAESTYNTPVTVDRFFEWLSGSGIEQDPNVVQGKGLRVGSSVDRAGRRVALVAKHSGKIKLEVLSKGFGTLLEGCFGTATSALVGGTGATYQQVFTPVVSGTYLKSYTIQEGIAKPGGTVDAYTWAGCTFTGLELSCDAGGIADLTVDVDGQSLATGTSYASPSYPTSPTLFAGGLPTAGAMTVGGTMTTPTTTALASIAGGTNVAAKSWSFSLDNGCDTGRELIGGRAQPTVGKRKIKVKTTVEYDATTGTVFRDAQIGQSATPILLTLATAESLSTGTATLQLALPACYIDGGAVPQPSSGDVITTDLEWQVLDNLTSIPAYLVLRTADTAL